MRFVGLDIGGANIKAAEASGAAASRSFALWKTPERLPEVVEEMLEAFSSGDAVALTMTAELADCFRTKAEGVASVLSGVEQAAGGRTVFVWQTGAEFVTPEVAREIPLLVSAANWHALAIWAGRVVPEGGALLIDIGSTTSDIIPLQNGVPVPEGLTDRRRLVSGELVYSGVRRTPVCAVASAVPLRGGECPPAAELFATTLDVYLLLGEIPEEPHHTDNCDTADGRPATIAAARDRLARMVCCDRTEVSPEEVQEMARFLAQAQEAQIGRAVDRVLGQMQQECPQVLLCGSGSFLGERIVQSHPRLRGSRITRLQELFDRRVSEAACAYAVAVLASERV